jgi:RNA polymerase sigma-70 factor (ECF subfamily)
MLSGAEVSSPSDILQDIRNGDKQAEKELVERYWRGLIFVLNNQCHDPDLTNDLAQDTFIIVINKARKGDIENPAALGAFIRQVGVNLVIAHFRKESRRKTDVDENIDIQFPDRAPSIQQSLGEKELTQVVKQVMDELPNQRDRELLYRYFVYGHTKQQICDDFELTLAHFDRVLYRARARLKKNLLQKVKSDPTNSTISHLFSIILVLSINNIDAFLVFSGNSVRVSVKQYHHLNIAVTERRNDELVNEQYQREAERV